MSNPGWSENRATWLSLEKQSVVMGHAVICHESKAYVDPWNILNNFCFNVYAVNSLMVGEIGIFSWEPAL